MALLEHVVVEDAGPGIAVADIPPGTRYVPERPLTVDEFYELIDEDSPAELDEGAIVMPSPASLHHEDCLSFLLTLLRLYVSARGLGVVLASSVRVRLGPRTARAPDLSFVASERSDILAELEIAGAPDLVVEIINSDKGRSEALAKVPQYERAGARELWLIDLPRRRLHQMRLQQGLYEETVLTDADELRAHVVPGFRLDVSLLFSAPGAYPPEWPILQELLR